MTEQIFATCHECGENFINYNQYAEHMVWHQECYKRNVDQPKTKSQSRAFFGLFNKKIKKNEVENMEDAQDKGELEFLKTELAKTNRQMNELAIAYGNRPSNVSATKKAKITVVIPLDKLGELSRYGAIESIEMVQ